MQNKTSCIKLIQTCKSLKHLKQIQTQLFILNLHQSQPTLKTLLLFSTHPSHNDFHHALSILTLTLSPSLFLHNLLIKPSLKSQKPQTTLTLFRNIIQQGLSPDSFTYPFVCKAIAALRDTSKAEGIHVLVVNSGSVSDTYVCNSIIDMYGELGRVDDAMSLFDEM